MKAKLLIDIKKIKRMKVDKELVKKIPQLKTSVENTILILCTQIDKYFKDHKIQTKTKLLKIENEK